MVSENTIYFYPGRGGHSHDGDNSSFIDTSQYSLFDFSWGIFGDPSRIADQTRNYVSFENFIIDTVNNAVLKPANIILQPGTVNGTSHIVSRSIDTGLITANAITANEILAGTITADELSADLVLVNNVIRSNNYVANVSGWAIDGDGTAEFANTSIRGTIQANSVTTPGIDIDSAGNLNANNFNLYANGAIYASGGNFQVSAGGILYATGANISGTIEASSVSTPGIDILSDGSISSANFNVTAGGNITATNVNLTGNINATSGSISGNLVSGGTISGVALQIGSNFAVDASGNLSANNASISGTITTGSLTGDLNLTNTGQVLGPGQVNVYGVMADIIIVNGEFAMGNNIGIKSLGNFSTTGSGTTARIHAPGSGGEIIRAPSSLRELKYNIQDINNALGILNQIRPRQYNWHIDGIDKLDPTTNEPWSDEARAIADLSISYGFIAQEIGEDYPALTVYKSPSLDLPKDQPGGYYDLSAWTPAMWKEMDMIPLLVKAVQELSEKIQSLEARLTEIEG